MIPNEAMQEFSLGIIHREIWGWLTGDPRLGDWAQPGGTGGRVPGIPDSSGAPGIPSGGGFRGDPYRDAGGCLNGSVWNPTNQRCIPTTAAAAGNGRSREQVPVFDFDPTVTTPAEAGQAGPGVPFHRQIIRRVCPKKHVLNTLGMCVLKSSIKNSDREWPAPRRPLLTGGDLNAIATAARAARRMQTAQKRMQKLGMLPKPKTGSRRAPAGHGHRLLTSGPTQTVRVISEESN